MLQTGESDGAYMYKFARLGSNRDDEIQFTRKRLMNSLFNFCWIELNRFGSKKIQRSYKIHNDWYQDRQVQCRKKTSNDAEENYQPFRAESQIHKIFNNEKLQHTIAYYTMQPKPNCNGISFSCISSASVPWFVELELCLHAHYLNDLVFILCFLCFSFFFSL